MALPSTLHVEIRTGGSNTACGGGFNPGNANMATDLAATSGTTSSPVVTSASYTFVAGDVDAWLFIQSGTNWTPGWYKIASVAGGAATLTAGAGTAVLYTANRRVFDANTVAGCATVASPTNGVWSVDYSQQNAAKISYTDMVIGATTTDFTSVANPLSKALVGNLVNVTSGTGFTVQFVEIVSVNLAGFVATCDKSLGTAASTGGVGALGGALLTWERVMGATGIVIAGNFVWVQSGTFTVTAAIVLSSSGSVAAGQITVQGYHLLRGDNTGTRPVLTSATNSINLINLNGKIYREWNNLKFTHTAATRGRGLYALSTSAGNYQTVFNCVFDGLLEAINGQNTTGFPMSHVRVEGCEIANSTGDGLVFGSSLFVVIQNNWIHDNSLTGCKVVTGTSDVRFEGNRFDTNGTDGLSIANFTMDIAVLANVFYANVGDGLDSAVTTSTTHLFYIENNIFDSNGAFGVNMQNALSIVPINRNNAYRNNTSGARNNLPAGRSDVTLTGDPFTSAATGDFTLNNTAGAGAACRGAGSPAYRDIGALQHQDAGGGGTTYVIAPVTNMFITEEVPY